MWHTLRIVLILALLSQAAGCPNINLGPWGGPAYTLDTSLIGTGQQAIVPRNDGWYANGLPMDARRR